MFAGGQPLMNRILPSAEPAELWQHYPPDDVVNGTAGSRYFYHCHPPAERSEGEHGHFHLFLDTSVMPDSVDPIIAPPAATSDEPRADVVHIGALAISTEGLPLCWFTTNRWVTDEWIYPAEAVIDQLAQFDLRGPDGDPLVNDWLTAMVGPVARRSCRLAASARRRARSARHDGRGSIGRNHQHHANRARTIVRRRGIAAAEGHPSPPALRRLIAFRRRR